MQNQSIKDGLSQNLNNPKQFWCQLDHLLNKSKSKTYHVVVNNETISDTAIISQAFNQHFSNISKISNNCFTVSGSLINGPHICPSFSFQKISPLDVFHAICDLKTNSSAGPGGLDVKFLKIAANV